MEFITPMFDIDINKHCNVNTREKFEAWTHYRETFNEESTNTLILYTNLTDTGLLKV